MIIPSFRILYKFSSIQDLFWNTEDYFQVSWISPNRNNLKDFYQKYQSGQQRTTDFISIIFGFDSALWQTTNNFLEGRWKFIKIFLTWVYRNDVQCSPNRSQRSQWVCWQDCLSQQVRRSPSTSWPWCRSTTAPQSSVWTRMRNIPLRMIQDF